MKKKIYLYILTVGLIVLIPFSCKKGFLDQTDSSNPTAQALFNKPADGIAIVNAIYDTYQNADLLKKSLWYYANFQSHDFFNWGNDRFYNTYAIPTTFGGIQVFWQRAYIGIARANSAIEILKTMREKGVLDEALANRLTGEVYFLRGMTYYYLGASFGGVPLELSNGANDGLKPRNTQDEVFAQVESDLKTAVNLLPWKEEYEAKEVGRASKGAALGYLGAAQMWQKKYADALASFNQLNGKYSLLPKFIDIHEYNNENNAESVFEVQFIVAGTQSWGAGNEVAWIGSFGMPEEVSNFGYDYGNKGLYDGFQSGDLRKVATIIGPGDINPSPAIIDRGGIQSYPLVIAGFASTDAAVKAKYTGTDGKIINTCGTVARPWVGSDNTIPRSGYYCEKMWRDPTLNGNSGNSTIFGAQNQILLRYGEILLSKAECQARTGDVAGALATLKTVRDRGFGGSAPAVYMSEGKVITDPLQMIYHEYRHELSGEYSTFYDLRRAGVATAFIKDVYNIDIPTGHELYPIPQYERGLNPNLTQNPGY
ncbi:RagB/SusD family nutrient uptake outer membrane protein [Mucilaginibacter phyllosphaerae]|uniref:RagB/SusD family nutrient uptake outer membrane protein n=1 Tax=Mucilaginibacter phyllosphaerae TaxID=1812349 RepID=A0A4Y8AIP1_9SPHI|nr:RagB/SusD family nutrient uptake outer membrane protein [Mucilaginibacter phyllosphaerae]MBB3968043.1 tetratricopeptide (TPR) repeat protein [Mucilaginibacter phyllosphaerae]TEW68934.1 RagB/SusD family nutrient uptake outer membrane protein [Mucilaginibacter phyllosphaerae]GGH01605.1 membrane protein [Mucilaginibacter phyllosphaerae]